MLRVIHTCHDVFCVHRFIQPLIENLRKNSYDVTVFTENTANFQRHQVKLEIPHKFVGVKLSINPLRFLQRAGRLVGEFRSSKPHIVHVHMTKGALLPLFAAWICRVPVRIYHNHGLPYLGYSGLLRFLLVSLEYIHCKLATDIAFVSESNRAEALKARLKSPDRTFVIRSGSAVGINLVPYQHLDKAHSKLRKDLGIPDNAVVYGYVGRPMIRKGFNLMVHAWQASQLWQGNAFLLLAGCNESDCQKLGVDPVTHKIKALGFVADIPHFYEACDIAALPSLHEGFGYALLEGAAARCALMGSDIPGIRDAIVDKVTGLLHPVGQQAAVVACMTSLFEDRPRCVSMGEAAFQRANARFSEADVVAGWIEKYRGLLVQQKQNKHGLPKSAKHRGVVKQ